MPFCSIHDSIATRHIRQTDNAADYEALALQLARNPLQLQALRERLARNRDNCPLFDTDRFRLHLEAAYTEMQARTLRGEKTGGCDILAADDTTGAKTATING